MESTGKQKILKIIGGLFLIVCFVLVYLLGVAVGQGNLELKRQGILPSIILHKEEQPKNITLDFKLFWDVWNELHKNFIGHVNDQDLFYGAISGMVSALKDPYTIFLNPVETKKFEQDLEGELEGIGAEIGIKNNQLVIIAPLNNSPAKKAGLKAGDVILKIDDEDTANLSLGEAIMKIRGPAGTKVTLTISRYGKMEKVTIKRAKIKIESVKLEFKNNNEIAYIKITRFDKNTVDLLDKTVNKILVKNPKGIILDLRDNPGGYLESAIDVASTFIKKGVIVIEESKEGKQKIYQTSRSATLADRPLVVLVNGGSASASEIVAGAIVDNERGTLIGEQTFGKGSVQSVNDFSDGSSLHITIAKWLTPKGKSISEEGLKPMIEIRDDENTLIDEQLEKAIEYIMETTR